MRNTLRLFAVGSCFCFAAAAHAETVAIAPAECQKLVQHVPKDDVTYKPGVDVHGKAVVPADVGSGYKLDLPQSIDIQIGLDLADRLGLRDSRKAGNAPGTQPTRKALPFEGYSAIGALSIRGNDAYWNGQRIVPQDEALLAAACQQGLSAAGITLPTPKPEPPSPNK